MATEQRTTSGNIDDPASDTKTNIPINIDIKTDEKVVKRKRGRPRKDQLENQVQTLSLSLDEDNDNYETRKKRKSSLTVKNYSIFYESNWESSESVHSLKAIKKERNPAEEVLKVQKKRGRTKKTFTPTLNGSTGIVAEKVEETQPDERESEQIKVEKNPKIPSTTAEDVVLEDNIESEVLSSHSLASESASTPVSLNKPSEYKKTGNTAVMVKHLFRGLQGKNVDDEVVEPDLGPTKRRKGRPKLNPDLDSYDENGETTCQVCKDVMQMRDWLTHKQQVHNNLAWKQGDVPMDLQDHALVQRTLNQLRKDQGFLKCPKCQLKIMAAKSFVSHFEICNDIVDSDGFVRCAICDTRMKKADWLYHRYRRHNNLAWRVGDTPLNLDDRDTIMHVLSALYKSRKPLHCEICDEQKKSVVGYLSHKSVCQLGGADADIVKVACNLCGKKVLPVSLDFHMKIHNKPKEEFTQVDTEFVADRPRRAATEALQVIKGISGEIGNSNSCYAAECDFQDSFVVRLLQKKAAERADLSCIFTNCTFKSIQVENMVAHLQSCDKKPAQYYVCKLCLTWKSKEEDIVQHSKVAHHRVSEEDKEFQEQCDGDESADDEVYYESEAHKKQLKCQSRLQTMNKDFKKVIPLFLLHPIAEDHCSLVYRHAYPWTLSFCEKFYSKTSLFKSIRNAAPWPLLNCDILNDYLPKNQQSCDVSFISLNQPIPFVAHEKTEFRSLDLFEIHRHGKDETTVFCGGPITSLAWLPTPHTEHENEQILAVSVLSNWDTEYSIGETYNERSVVQFWNFGPLSSSQESHFEPIFLYGLALNSGPVWHLEWCPSGCLDKTESDAANNRLGLLAVAGSNSFAYIYSIDSMGGDTGLFYKGEPVVKLQLASEKSTNVSPCYATKISWTKAEGHRYIAVGYTTGVIALYDIVSASGILRRTDSNGVQSILPYKCFQAHFTQIISLTLSHLDGGNRFCCSASHDKLTTYWDLSNTTKLFSLRMNSMVDSLWPTHWPMSLVGEDETTFIDIKSAHTYATILRYSLTSTQKTAVTDSPSGIGALGFSDWLNLIMHGGNAGDVMGRFTHRLFGNIENKKITRRYVNCVFSTAQLIKKNPAEEDKTDQFTFHEISKHYGLALVDYNSDNIGNIPNSRNKKIAEVFNKVKKYDVSNYPLQAVNKVAPNPNRQAYSFYAIGLHAGFVRVRNMRFLDKSFSPLVFTDKSFTESL